VPYDLEYTRDLGYCAAKYLLAGGNGVTVSLQEFRAHFGYLIESEPPPLVIVPNPAFAPHATAELEAAESLRVM